MIKIAMNLAGVNGGIQSAIAGTIRDTSGCVPLTVDFRDTVGTAQSYEWYFEYVPGNPPDQVTTTPNASHIYNTIGTFQVMLVAIDPNTCNVRDSSFLTIRVGNLVAALAFNPVKLAPCNAFSYRFDNLSVAPAVRPFGPLSFIWDFGDGSPRIQTGSAPVFHSYAGPGTYNVKLILPDTNYCNAPDSLIIPLSVASNEEHNLLQQQQAVCHTMLCSEILHLPDKPGFGILGMVLLPLHLNQHIYTPSPELIMYS